MDRARHARRRELGPRALRPALRLPPGAAGGPGHGRCCRHPARRARARARHRLRRRGVRPLRRVDGGDHLRALPDRGAAAHAAGGQPWRGARAHDVARRERRARPRGRLRGGRVHGISMNVPFLDLAAQDGEVGAEVRAALAEVLASQAFVLGPHVERFEAAMAAYCGVPHAIGVASGTDALFLALGALGVGPGVSVLTTPFSFWATASTVVRLGARPLFADIDPATFNLDPVTAEATLAATRERVVGLLPVHLFGRLAPMRALGALAERHGLWVVEDAAQAVGARADGVRAGAFGRAGCLSFYPTKNLGGLGDGGMVLTHDAALAARVRQERHQGHSATPYVHASLGLASRLDAVQAAALGAKLPRLDAWNARRRAIAERYGRLFAEAGLAGRPDAPLVLPEPAGEAHVFHQYVVRARDRDALQAHLATAAIGAQVYYRMPLHLQPPLAALGFRRGAFPEAERAAAEVLALPIYPELDDRAVETVVEAVVAFYG